MNSSCVVLILLTLLQAGLVAVALTGLGYRFCRLLDTDRFFDPLGWPIYALLGLSCAILLSSLNIFFFHANSAAYHCAILIPGLFFYLKDRKKMKGPPGKSQGGLAGAFVFITYLIWFLLLIKALVYPLYDIIDDNLFYLNQIKSLMDRADISAPFAFRRLLSYGGQPISQSIFLLFSKLEFAVIFEQGFVNLAVISLFYRIGPMMRKSFSAHESIFCSVMGIVYLATEQSRENIGSQSSGFFFFLAALAVFWMLFEKEPSRREPGYPICFQLALLLAAFASLKGTHVLAALMLLALIPLVAGARKAAFTIAIFFVLLSPFIAGMHLSANTFFYPLWKGNAIDVGVYNNSSTIIENIYFFLGVIWGSGSYLLLPLAITAHQLPAPEKRFPLILICGSTLFFFALNLNILALDLSSCIRFMFPVISGTIFFLLFLLFFEYRKKMAAPKQFFFWAMAALFAASYAKTIVNRYYYNAAEFYDSDNIAGILSSHAQASAAIRALQDKTPPGKAIATFVPKPYLFDQKRNPIHSLDELGSAAPASPFLDKEGFAFDTYFSSLGYEYFIFTDPQAAEAPYGKIRWLPETRFAPRVPGKGFLEANDLHMRERTFVNRRKKYLIIYAYLDKLMAEGNDVAQSGESWLHYIR